MSNQSSDKQAIRRGNPVSKYGLQWYPITMEHYEEWQDCKPALLLRQSTLPAEYAVMPYLSAVYAFETATGAGLFARLYKILSLTLRLPPEYSAQLVKIRVERENQSKLVSLCITQGEMTAEIKPVQFSEIRSLLAEQNAEKLPDEADSAELIEAQNDVAKHVDVNYDTDDLIASVALAKGVDEEAILEWTIRKFEYTRRAVDRSKNYTISAISEGNGAKWKNGNPYPSWCFDRRNGDCAALVSMSEMGQKLSGVVTEHSTL